MNSVGATCQESMGAHDTAATFADRSPSRQQVLMPSLQNKCQSLVRDFEKPGRAGNTAVSRFEGFLDQVRFVSQNLLVK